MLNYEDNDVPRTTRSQLLNYEDERPEYQPELDANKMTYAQRERYKLTDNTFYDTTGVADEEYATYHQMNGNRYGHKSRNWCFTWNNPHPDHEELLCSKLTGMTYLIFGREVAPTTGTKHLQGFVVFKSDNSFGVKKNGQYHPSSLKGKFPQVYWKPMYSTPEACIKYCSKGGDVFSVGNPPKGQGARSDLEDLVQSILSRSYTLDEIATKYPHQFIKYPRGIRELFSTCEQYNGERPRSVWFYGASGKGKTGYSMAKYPPSDVYIKRDGGLFFINYRQQPVVVIDEFVPFSQMYPRGWHWKDLLACLDRYMLDLHIKGAQTKFNSKVIYVTSVKHPKEFIPPGEDPIQL